MKKYFKIIVSVLFTLSMYCICYFSILYGNKCSYNTWQYWVCIFIVGWFFVPPILKHYWNWFNKKLWNIHPDTYTGTDVLKILNDFMDDTMSRKITNKDEFNKWLNNRGL